MRSLVAAALLLCACSDRFYTLGFSSAIDTPLGRDPMGRERTIAAHALGDLDGDGSDDVVAVTVNGELNVLLSRRDGGFNVGVAYQTQNVGGTYGVTAGDLTEDGLADVVINHIDQNRISLFIGQGAGLLAASQAQPTLDVGCKAAATLISDLDGDRRPDLVIACKEGPREIHVLRNQGGGMLAPSITLPYVMPASGGNIPDPRGIAIGELNGDGLPDIAVATAMDLRILTSPREANGLLEASLLSIPYTSATRSVAIGDIDGNGRSNVAALIGEPSGSTAVIAYEHGSGGSYTQNVTLSGVQQSGRNSGNQALYLTDCNGDGRADVLITQINQAELKAVPSRGASGIVADPPAAVTSLAAGPNGSTINEVIPQVGDIDGDGHPDVVLRYPGASRIGVLINGAY